MATKHNILNMNDHVLYDKVNKDKNKISLPEFSIRLLSMSPTGLPVNAPPEMPKYLKYTSYDYINYITKLLMED